jgi:hypothetical protein
MSQSSVNAESLKEAAGRHLADDDGNPIGSREWCVSEGLHASAGDGLTRAIASLTPAEITQVVANRAVIERAKGMLMFIYDIDADSAFELLKWRSQTTNVKLRQLARQLTEDLVVVNRDGGAATRVACDSLLYTVDERITPAANGH